MLLRSPRPESGMSPFPDRPNSRCETQVGQSSGARRRIRGQAQRATRSQRIDSPTSVSSASSVLFPGLLPCAAGSVSRMRDLYTTGHDALAYATSEEGVLVKFNVTHFARLHTTWIAHGRPTTFRPTTIGARPRAPHLLALTMSCSPIPFFPPIPCTTLTRIASRTAEPF